MINKASKKSSRKWVENRRATKQAYEMSQRVFYDRCYLEANEVFMKEKKKDTTDTSLRSLFEMSLRLNWLNRFKTN